MTVVVLSVAVAEPSLIEIVNVVVSVKPGVTRFAVGVKTRLSMAICASAALVAV